MAEKNSYQGWIPVLNNVLSYSNNNISHSLTGMKF